MKQRTAPTDLASVERELVSAIDDAMVAARSRGIDLNADGGAAACSLNLLDDPTVAKAVAHVGALTTLRAAMLQGEGVTW